jgi:thiamine biosynthesis lipoprotein
VFVSGLFTRGISTALLLLVASSAAAEWYRVETTKMGTRVRIEFWLEAEAPLQAVKAALLQQSSLDEFDRLEALLSTYRPDSEISRVNQRAFEKPQQVSAETHALIDVAIQMSELTDGAFDISYESVGYLYDFNANLRPNAMELAAGIDAVDYRKIELNAEQLSVAFAQSGMRINLGGIAKGYACEQVIKLLKDKGIEHALVSAGGDMRVLGDYRGQPWVVGVKDPADQEKTFTRLALMDEAISTSGDYERFFIENGERYHHILNPADGKPARDVRSVSVVGPDATLTDALSTSLFVLGAEAGMELLESFPGYEALIIVDEKTWYYSGGLSSE